MSCYPSYTHTAYGWECDLCGALVVHTATHDIWHGQLCAELNHDDEVY